MQQNDRAKRPNTFDLPQRQKRKAEAWRRWSGAHARFLCCDRAVLEHDGLRVGGIPTFPQYLLGTGMAFAATGADAQLIPQFGH